MAVAAVVGSAARQALGRPQQKKLLRLARLTTAALPTVSSLLSTDGLPVEVSKVPGAGNGLLAARDIQYGERVLGARPKLAYPSLERMNKVCYHCLRDTLVSSSPVIRAGRSFCSSECSEAAWSSYLEVESLIDTAPMRRHCEQAGEKFPLMASRLACQVISQHCGSAPPPQLQGEVDEWMSPLCYVAMNTAPEAWEDTWFVMADAMRHLELPGLTKDKLRWLLSERIGSAWFCSVLSRLHTNSFKVSYPAPMADGFISLRNMDLSSLSEGLGPQSGTACYGLASMFNHSCEPNVDVNFPSQDSEAVFTAARDISQSEQLFISYINSAQSLENRQRQLRWAYGFDCQCQLCRDELSERSP